MVDEVCERLCGSADLYQSSHRHPINSVNFVTAHDGFTLADLVAYDRKHNEANGEGNRDGVDENLSWNCGAEGPTDDPAVLGLRVRQIKNFATILMLSQGVPMLVMGDEVGRSQGGNNNAWCHDDPVSWFDWSLPQENHGLLRFWSLLIAFRRRHGTVHRSRHFDGTVNERGLADVTWHGVELNRPDRSDGSRSIAFTLAGFGEEADLHIILNMYWEPLEFALPEVASRRWHRVIDTALGSPDDIADAEADAPVAGQPYRAQARSVVVLVNRRT
jgi:glycogen operon protein